MDARGEQETPDPDGPELKLGGKPHRNGAAGDDTSMQVHGLVMDASGLASLAELGADWLWETDHEHKFTWVSDSFEAITDVDPAELIGHSRLEFVKDVAQSSASAEAHLAVLEAREPFRDFVYQANNASERCRWVAISGVPRFGDNGVFIGYRGIGRNVTQFLDFFDDLREARRELSLAEGRERARSEALAGNERSERLVTALDEIQDAICFYDSEDRLVLYNKAMVDMYAGLEDVIRPGLTFAGLVEAGLERGIWKTDGVSSEEWKAGALAMRRDKPRSETVLAFRDGRWIMNRSKRTDDGGMIGISTDITRIKRHEAELEDARNEADATRLRLQSAVEALKDGFVLWDSEDRLVACNDAFRRQFSFMPDMREGRKAEDALLDFARTGAVPDAVGREEEWVREAVQKRAEELDQEITFQTHDGRWIMRRDQLTESGDRVGIRTDVTEHKRAAEELAIAKEESETALSDLKRTIDAMRMGIVVLDSELKAGIINKAFYELWKVTPKQVPVGSPFRALMDVNRNNGIYDVADDQWDEYVESRIAEIRAGDVAPREFERADDCTMIYSVTALSGGRRLVTYYDVTRLKNREAELAEALERAKLAESVIDSIPNPIFVKNTDLEFVLANRAFAKLFEVSPEDMNGRKGADFVPPEDAKVFEESERQVLDTGEDYENEENFEFSGIGRSRIVRKHRVRTESGTSYVACTIFDVTEMKNRERDAEQARSQLADVIESLPAGVIIYDSNDRFVLANRKVQDALPGMVHAMQPGKPLREAVEAAHDAGYFRESGDPDLDAIYEDREAWIEGYAKRYQARHHVFERKNPDGRWFQAFDTRTEDGTFVGVRVDITELKERETALQESQRENELFQNLIDNVPVAIYAKYPDLKLKYVNRAWCELTGESKENAIGRTDADIFGDSGEAFMDGDRAVLETGETQVIEETRTEPDGTIRYWIARKNSIVASDGSLYLMGSTTDVTELRRREEELHIAREQAELADRAKSEFLANMSHEIRTPMNGVLGMAELLAKSELTPKQKTFTDIIAKSGNALLTIINDILDFSKIDAGQLVLDPAPFDLAEAIEDVATLVSTRAKEKNLELIVRVDPQLPPTFVGDAGRIRQIVTNLMGNAVKFTEEGHVLVDVRGERHVDGGMTLHFDVTDTGIGIPEEKRKLVFEKFSQVDSSSTRTHEGTGLGLAIMSRLVDMMGGTVGVESAEGKGSTFWFEITLPVAEHRKSASPAPLDVSGARILIVDDNSVNRSILSEQMQSWGFDSCAACSGQEGLDVLDAAVRRGITVDCMILDYQMPGMNGIDVARKIRGTQAISRVPILMLTSVDQALSGTICRDLGIEAQLIKPTRSSALLETLVDILQRHRSRSAAAENDRPTKPEPAVSEASTPGSVAQVEHDAKPGPFRDVGASSGETHPAGHRVDILVAEDNEVNQLVFTQILGESGLTYELAANGRLAVEACREMNPRMILMDVSMPEMNGLEATAAIRALEAEGAPHVPIIGVTAHALKGDRERCLEAGMDDYLSKPISPKTLMQKIERWLGTPGRERSSA